MKNHQLATHGPHLVATSADTLVALSPLPSSRVYPGNAAYDSPAPRANTAQGMYSNRNRVVAAVSGTPERTNTDLPTVAYGASGGVYSSSEFVLTVGDDDEDDEDESEYADEQMQKQRLVGEDRKGSGGVDWGLGRCDSGQCPQQAGFRRDGRSISPMEAEANGAQAHARRIPWYKDGCFLSKAAIFLVILSWIALVMYMVLSYDPSAAGSTPSPAPSSPPPSS